MRRPPTLRPWLAIELYSGEYRGVNAPTTLRPKIARGGIALGGGAFGPEIIDGRQCSEAAREFFGWLLRGQLPPSCR